MNKSNVKDLRAAARALFSVAGHGEEPELLVGLALAARDAGNYNFLRVVNLALTSLGMPRVLIGDGDTEEPIAPKGPRNEDTTTNDHPTGEHRIPGSSAVWRSATRKTYGGAPLRRGERVLIWLTGRLDRGQANEPVVAICAGIDDRENEPVFRSLEVMAHQDDLYFDLPFVDTLDELRPGTWTRLPW